MRMTTHSQQDQTTSSKAPHQLRLDAKVTVTDKTGTSVEARTISQAIKLIRRRLHDDDNLGAKVVLDDSHYARGHRGLFEDAWWLITEQQVQALTRAARPAERDIDYRLLFHSFTVLDPEDETPAPRPVKDLAALPVAMAKSAESTNVAVQLSSKLLGFTSPVFNPGEPHPWEQTEEQPASVLGSLDPALFDEEPDTEENTGEDTDEAAGAEAGSAASAETPEEPAEDHQTAPASTLEDYIPQFQNVSVADLTSTESTETQQGFDELFEDDQDLEVEQLADHQDLEADQQPETPAVAPRHRGASKALVPHPETEEQRTRREQRQARRNKQIIIAAAATIVVLCLAGAFALWQLLWPSGTPGDAEQTVDQTPDWVTQAPTVGEADQPVTEDYQQELWSLPAEDAQEVAWFSAGVAMIDPDDEDLVLLDTQSGDEIAEVSLAGPVQWTSEFVHGETPAIAARTEDSFVAITAEGDTQAWELDEDDQIGVYGSTPMLTDADGEVSALVVGEDDPVEVSTNPRFHASAIDGETLIQVSSGTPEIVLNPMTDDAEHEASQVRLHSPADGAEFTQHLSVGHGLSLSAWSIDGESALVVHDLTSGEVTAAVEAPDELTGWSIGRGMDLAIVGPYAFDLATGDLEAESPHGEFTTALGPAAVSPTGEGRSLLIDHTEHYESIETIGLTGNGTALVREPDGSVSALGLSQGEGAIS